MDGRPILGRSATAMAGRQRLTLNTNAVHPNRAHLFTVRRSVF
jgi:hypothetical protein